MRISFPITPAVNAYQVSDTSFQPEYKSNVLNSKPDTVSFKGKKLEDQLDFMFVQYADEVSNTDKSDKDLIEKGTFRFIEDLSAANPKLKGQIYTRTEFTSNDTLMHFFASLGRYSLAKKVLEDQDLNLCKQQILRTRNNEGESSLDVAVDFGQYKIVKLIVNNASYETLKGLLFERSPNDETKQAESLVDRLKRDYKDYTSPNEKKIAHFILSKAIKIKNIFSPENIEKAFTKKSTSEHHRKILMTIKDINGDNILQACIKRGDLSSAFEVMAELHKPENLKYKKRILSEKGLDGTVFDIAESKGYKNFIDFMKQNSHTLQKKRTKE